MDDILPTSNHPGSPWLGIFILMGAILLVALCLFFWAAFIRKTNRRKRKYRRQHKSYREELEKGVSGLQELANEKRDRHRREHRPLNPTLAQTGGLPPRRDPNDQSPSPDAT